MIVLNCEQGTPEWEDARRGRATASEFSSVLAKGQGKTRTAYLRRLVAERLTGKSHQGFKNAHIERGHEQETFARAAYELAIGCMVEQIGFAQHDTIMAGASPDGLVGEDRGVEIKSVIPTVQIDTILAGGFPSEHRAQIQGNLWITGRKVWDFCSYCEDMPEHLQTYIFPVDRDEKFIVTLQAEVTVFLREVDELEKQLRGIK